MNKRLLIGIPYLKEADGTVRLCAELELRGQKETIWISVDRKYGQYLTDDRADAFVVGLLPTAMQDGTDIICEAPVSRRLLYQLRHYLIPILTANLPGYQAITLTAEPTDEKLPCARAVATGWTGGVDSMFTLMKTLHTEEPGHRLTHLMIANNGALESRESELGITKGEDNSGLLAALVEKAEQGILKEPGLERLEVVGINSNIQQLIPEPFLAVLDYRQAAVILALQKLFGIYYNSAGCEFSRFAFDVNSCAYFELVLLENFCTDNTTFYSAYGAYSRAQKLKVLSDYPLAQKHLHPCVHALPERNCGRCGKCVRTMATLYGLGTLDKFSAVFDVEEFYREKDSYIAEVLAHKESHHYGEALVLMKQRGIEPSPEAMRLARVIRAAEHVVENHREMLERKFNLK